LLLQFVDIALLVFGEHVVTTTRLSPTGIPGESTIRGTSSNGIETSDDSGGYLFKSDVLIAAPAGYGAYEQGRLTLDVTSDETVKSGELVLGAAGSEPAIVAMMAIGPGAVLGGYQIGRCKAAKT
jgi:hypothetical protein